MKNNIYFAFFSATLMNLSTLAFAQSTVDVGLGGMASVTTINTSFLTNDDLSALHCIHNDFSSRENYPLQAFAKNLRNQPVDFGRYISRMITSCHADISSSIYSEASLGEFFLRGVIRFNLRLNPNQRALATEAQRARSDHLDDLLSKVWGGSAITRDIREIKTGSLLNYLEAEKFPSEHKPAVSDFLFSLAYFREDYEVIGSAVTQGHLQNAACNTRHQPTSKTDLPCFMGYIFSSNLKSPLLYEALSTDITDLLVMILRNALVNNLSYGTRRKLNYIADRLEEECAYEKSVEL